MDLCLHINMGMDTRPSHAKFSWTNSMTLLSCWGQNHSGVTDSELEAHLNTCSTVFLLMLSNPLAAGAASLSLYTYTSMQSLWPHTYKAHLFLRPSQGTQCHLCRIQNGKHLPLSFLLGVFCLASMYVLQSSFFLGIAAHLRLPIQARAGVLVKKPLGFYPTPLCLA